MDTSRLAEKPFHRGAEADLLLSSIDQWSLVVKRRTKKNYRHESLDDSIRRQRTLSEADTMHQAKVAGAKVPSIIGIDLETNTILMTRIEGTVLRDGLDVMNRANALELFQSLGAQIGLLHSAGVVHGDLTTSNIVVTKSGHPFIVDFGMSRRSSDPEDRGVDLHLLQRSVTTSHVKNASPLFKALGRGYEETAGQEIRQSSWAKAREIARRGRYFAIR